MTISNRQGASTPDRGGDAPIIFVTGASRSGTTMLARMLGAHGEVLMLNELHYFGDLWHPSAAPAELQESELTGLAARLLARHRRGLWSGRPQPEELERAAAVVRAMAPENRNAAALFTATLGQMARDAGRRFACEQTPRNIFYAERLLSLFPEARVVHMVRDPRAVLASQKHRWQLRRLGARHLPRREMLRNRVNYHPFTVARLWRAASAEALRLAGHPRVLLVRFEELAADPAGGMKRICTFLGLACEPAMLAPPRWGSSTLTHSAAMTGVAGEVVDRWRQLLGRSEILSCERMTAGVMAPLGYAPTLLGRCSTLTLLPSLLTFPLHLLGVAALNPGRALTQLRAMAKGC